MKLQKSKHGQYTLTLPKPIAEAKGWEHGTELVVKFGPKGEVILEEKKECI